ncbi:MAG: endo-1,4-beta-xylanase [Treponema sp.]|nr:endo-1,4-beta-xylanase [Treponema sp.]
MKTKKPILIACAALLAFAFASCPTDTIDPTDLPSLREAWAPYFPLGNIVASFSYTWRHRPADIGNSTRWSLLQHHFDILTAEDEMKPDAINVQAASYRWDRAYRIVDTARASGMRVHGHTLVWHSQSPQWLAPPGVSRATATANMREHIETVMTRLGNRVESWDVLNEVVMTGGPGVGDGFWPWYITDAGLPWGTNWNWRQNGVLRRPPIATDYTNWFTPMGFDFVETAFLQAREVARANNLDVVLYYNDYNLNIPRKRFAVYHMVRDINNRNRAALNGENLIQAIGMQAHYWLPGSVGGQNRQPPAAVCPWDVRDSLVRFASLGVYISITEMDIFAGGRAMDQAIMYARLFNLFRSFTVAQRARNEPGLRRVSIWGIDDPSSWRAQYNPLLFDGRLNPKQAFWAVLDPDAFLAEHAPRYLGEFSGDNFTGFNWRP